MSLAGRALEVQSPGVGTGESLANVVSDLPGHLGKSRLGDDARALGWRGPSRWERPDGARGGGGMLDGLRRENGLTAALATVGVFLYGNVLLVVVVAVVVVIVAVCVTVGYAVERIRVDRREGGVGMVCPRRREGRPRNGRGAG